MKTKKLLTALALVSVVLMAGCKKDDFNEIAGKCPEVVNTNPLNGALNVPLNQIITANFNEKMNPETLTAGSFTVQGTATTRAATATIEGVVTYRDSTVIFTPAEALTPGMTYTGRIKTTVKDLMGNALQTDYTWTFSTGALLAPTVISTTPLNTETGVALNSIISATFSIPMELATITGTSFTLKQGTTLVVGSVSYTDSTAIFSPSNALKPNSVYTGTITVGVTNKLGTALENDFEWSFTTRDITPSIIGTDPYNSETNVPVNKTINATFSIPMNGATVITAFTLKAGTTVIPGVVTLVDSTASFNPNNDLEEGTSYRASISTAAKNNLGTPIASNYEWTFRTTSTIDITIPSPVDLKSVARFGIISGVGVSNNAGQSEIHNLDVGIYPGARSSITGFPPAIMVNGEIFAADDGGAVAVMLNQAKLDLVAAYLFAEGVAPIATVAGDLGGTTLAPGVYKSTSTLLIQSGSLTLDAQGDANAYWIFQVASDFTTVGGAGGNVILTGGAQAKNVFWQVGRSATIGDYTTFNGNVLALTSITMNSHATAVGRMLAQNGSVVMTSTNKITKP